MKIIFTVLLLILIVAIYLFFLGLMLIYFQNKEWPEFTLALIVFILYSWLLARLETRREAG